MNISKVKMMSVIIVVCSLVILVIATSGCLSMSTSEVSIETIEELDTFIANQVSTHEVPGASVSIVANGEVVWSQGYGLANVEKELPVTADTPFMIASISKAVAGAALMKAVEEGQFDLDDDINTLLPFAVDNPQIEGEVITLRHLATHTSGLVYEFWNSEIPNIWKPLGIRPLFPA